jgi:phosphinothricin acetyltransferase
MVAIITSSAENSIGLHKKHGFEILGQFPELGYKFNSWHNITHMQKKL